MRHLVLGFLVACAADGEQLASTEQDVSRTELERRGYQCRSHGPLQSKCVKCTPVEVEGDGGSFWVLACIEYTCENGTGNCEQTRSWVPDQTLDQDMNYWFELEAASRTGSVQAVGADPGASGGAYVSFSGGHTRSTFSAPYAHTVTAWVRAIAPSTAANSFYLQLDTAIDHVELPVATTWTWIPLHTSHFVDAGSHTLQIHTGEAGVKIDRILLTNNFAFVPVVHTVQAEAYGWVPPMTSGTQRTIPPTTYVWVPNGAGTGGLVQLEIAVPYTGNYVVWGRVHAPTEADNSFYLAKLGESRVAWGMPVASGWQWDRADAAGDPFTYFFTKSEILEIAQREDGTKLDKIVVTNDPGFTLVEPPPPSNTF